MISINWSLLIQIVNFLFLIWVLNMVLYKPIRNILIQRKEKISGLQEEIETLNGKAKDKDGAFVSGLKNARAKGAKEREILLKAAGDEEKKIVEKINKEAQVELAAVREKISKDAEEAGAALEQQLDVFAKAIGEKILGRAI
ncbi:MAG TPA: ATP synthase F0 subunit B [Desulfobacterales bacterium]|nr:ATP synthase F0 subunit B [Desulfobacterales bacterium]